ncbi:META domain-containing protein [Fibrella forsythiae]|uniref:META domain-containing protein n=1 Tax=Fibrella forsythiae TaxID=2817061 RepID=A0ABS3JHB2_9BACT|nr:META domain-containing protein [Fibrella forsythiae]MBO0949391.1 META domain-containing protein [Fibrella forsythiae]
MKQVVVMGLLSAWALSFTSCQRASQPATAVSSRPKVAALPESEMWRSKRQNGIDFVAAGITPAEWSMDIDFSKQIIFKPLSGSTLVASMPKPKPIGTNSSGVLLDVGPRSVRNEAGVLVASTSKKSYASRLGGVKVYIEPVVARDNLTGRTYAYTVRVETGGRRYVGYGAFIKGSDRLNGTWTLETLHGQRVRAGQFPNHELPQITINLTDNSLEGTTGCNKLKGDVQADGDHVQFVIRNTTSKKCNNPLEDDYLTALNQASLFRIGKDRLTLLANGQYVMTFRTETSEKVTPNKSR